MMRYDPCGRMQVAGSYPWVLHAVLKASMSAGASAGEVHLRWFLRKRARELPPMRSALGSAFWTPLERLARDAQDDCGEGTFGHADVGAQQHFRGEGAGGERNHFCRGASFLSGSCWLAFLWRCGFGAGFCVGGGLDLAFTGCFRSDVYGGLGFGCACSSSPGRFDGCFLVFFIRDFVVSFVVRLLVDHGFGCPLCSNRRPLRNHFLGGLVRWCR